MSKLPLFIRRSTFGVRRSAFCLAFVFLAIGVSPMHAAQKISELPVTQTLTPSDALIVNHDIGAGTPQTSSITVENVFRAVALSNPYSILRDFFQLATRGVDTRIAGQTPGSATQNLFTTRDNATPAYVRNTSGILRDVDLSAISVWTSNADPRKTVTLIAPDIALGANHFYPANGDTVRFVSRNNELVTLTVQSSAQIGATDIQVIRFSAAAPSTIVPMKLLASDTALAAAPAFFVDQNHKAWTGDIGLSAAVALAVSPNPTRAAFWTPAVSGDSSHPIFAILGYEPVLLANLSQITFGDRLSNYTSTINSTITSLGSASQISYFPATSAGTAAQYQASVNATAGEIPVVDTNGRLNPSILPGSVGGNVYPMQVFAGPISGSPAVPTFRFLASGDLPERLTASWFFASFSDANYTFASPSLVTVLQQQGVLSAARNVYLPAISRDNNGFGGQVLIIQDQSGTCTPSRSITINASSGTTIEGNATLVLSSPRESVMLVGNDSRNVPLDWKIVARFKPAAAAIADTSGATLGQLETQVNSLKALLRSASLLAP